MKKIHGTHSIQPLTITDAVVAEDAQISESKIALAHTTANLQTDIDNLESTLNAHMEDDADPHGEVLQQTTIRTENITSNVSETDRTITVSNPGGGDLLLDVQGDINCNNLGVSGDTNIDGMTSIGGQTHITGNVLIDGDLTVTGRSTTVTSNTIDYDSLLVTPSTATNRTGIIVAPDGTGYEEGEGQSQTTTETITVHDDIVDAAEGMFYAPTRELSNGDLIITLPNRIVRTNSEATEIKATYFIMDEDAEHIIEQGMTCATAVNDNDEIYAIINSDLGFIVRVLNSNLELIREAGPLFNGQDPGLVDVRSFDYNNGKFYALYSFADNSHGIYVYDETFIAKGSDEEFPNDLEYGSGSSSVSGLHSSLAYSTELSDINPISICPFTHNGMDYIFIITTGNMFVVDAQNLHLQGYEMFDTTDENYDPSNFEDTAYNSVLDPYNKMIYTVFFCFVYGFPVTQFIDAQTYVSPSGQAIDATTSTIPVVFDTAFASEQDMVDADTNFMGWIQGTLTDGSLLYYSDISHNMYWLNPEEFGDLTMEEAAEQELELEFSPGIEADFVTHVRRFIVTDEDEVSSEEDDTTTSENANILISEGAGFFKEYQGTLYFIGDIYTAHAKGSPEYIQRLDVDTGLLGDAVKAERHSSNEVLYYIDTTSQDLPPVTGIDIDSEQNALVVYEKDPTYFTGFNLEDGSRFQLNQDSVDLYNARVKPVGSVTVNNSEQVVCFVYNYTDNANPVWEIRLYPATGGQATKTILINDIVADYELEMSRGAISPDGQWLYCLGYHYNTSTYEVDDIKLYGFNLEGSTTPIANSADCKVYSLNMNLTLIVSVTFPGLCITSDGRAVAAIVLTRDAAPRTYYTLTNLVEIDISDGSVLSDKLFYNSIISGVVAVGTTIFTGIKCAPNYKNDILILDISNNGHIDTATPRSVLGINGVTEDNGSGNEEYQDPFEIDPTSDPLSSYGLDNFGAVMMTTDADGNFYFVSNAQLADCITKVDAETLKSVSIRVGNTLTESEYMFGYRGIYGLGMSSDKSKFYVSCCSMHNEVGPTALYSYDLNTRMCNPLNRITDYLQGSYDYGDIWPFRNIWFHSMTMDYENNRIVLIGGTTDQQNDLGGILILDPEDYSTIKYIQVTSVHPYVRNDRGCVMLCVSSDGDYAYVLEYYTEDGLYNSPRKVALNKIPLNTEAASYDPSTSPDCIRIALYGTEDMATYGYPVSIKITPEGRLFVATISGHVFELDSDTLNIVEETDLLSASEKEERYGILSMAVNNDTLLVGYENDDSNWNLENYGLRAYDISNGTLLSEATVTESVPYDGPTPAAPVLPGEESEEPEEPYEPEEPEDINGVDLIRTRTEEVEVVEEVGDTFTGNLLELQKRTNGLNEAAVIVDKHGNLDLLTGDLNIGDTNISDRDSGLVVNNDVVASSITTTDKGFKYEASTDAGASNKVIDVQNSSGVSKFFVDKAGNASANTLQIGSSLPVVWNNTDDSITFSSSVTVADRSINLDDSEIIVSSDNKTDWRILNRNSTLSFYYGNSSLVPQVEMGDNLFDTSSSNMTKVNNLLVCGDANFRGNVTMASGMLMDGIHLGSHDHSGGDMGVILPQTSVSGLKNFVDNINTTIRNCVDTMTTNNIESGINVAYNSTTEKLNFTVNDFTLTLTGEAEGSATIAHASNTSLAVTVKNSAKLGGLSLPSGTANTEANKVLRTDSNANTTVKTLSISTPVNAGTASIAKIYASTGSETAVKYYTPANFATQILALGGTVKNSHVHTAVNGLTPLRGSGSFAGTSGKRVNLPASRADTSYTVSITPTANPGGQLGEVWVVKSTAYFTVYNSGTFTGAFDYIVLG